MGWIAVLVLAAVAFALAVFALRLPKAGFMLFGSALLFGLAGYAWQGSPDQPGSPKASQVQQVRWGESMVAARRSLFDPTAPKPDYLNLSDGFARRGQYGDAAALLRKGLNDNPDHLEGWLALAMALTSHADGVVTPAAEYAFDQARAADPRNPSSDFFLGIALFQSGEIIRARDVLAALLERTPDDAPWKEELEQRVAGLDRMIANAPMLR